MITTLDANGPYHPPDPNKRAPRRFMVSYNYAQGELWAYVWADSRETLAREFPELDIHDPEPAYVTVEAREGIKKESTYHLPEDSDNGLLGDIGRARQH